ncbi:QRFP-like peptide receptor [Anneissia japonica]|uniref:QRFP-like peptide receptor n=1 Tax=Anneissia japonica TaxID=1529436 RepID=UPI0014258A1C|nr:QRFP-like peptide receptor [Anneissia japonica]
MELVWAWNHPERSEGHAHIWFCVYTVIGISGFLANLLVLIVFKHLKLSSTDRNKVTTTLIIHQSIIDLISSIVFLPFYTIPEGWLILDDWAGSIFCKCRSIFWILAGSSTGNIVLIAIERYFAIVHPIKHYVHFRKGTVLKILPHVYIYGIVSCVHLAFIADLNEFYYCEYYWNKIQIQKLGGIHALLFMYILPTVIIVFAYGKIVYKLYVKRLRGPRCFNNRRDENQRNIIVTFIIVSIAYMVCWTPDMILYFVYNLTGGEKPPNMSSGNLHRSTVLLSVSNVVVNPFIYALKYKLFRKGLIKIFRKQDG